MPSPKCHVPPEKLELYEKALHAIPEVERKGAANPYTSVNGNMFTIMSPSGTLAVRLPPTEREKFLAKYQSKLYEAYGVVMKEYVTVPEALLQKTRELQKYVAMSYQYAKALKPKPTTRKKH